MRLSDFDFDLPEDHIAQRPAEPRDAARLLVVRPGEPLADHVVRGLPDFLRPGDALVFNDTRVIPARLSGLREGRTTGGADGTPVAVEATLHRRVSPSRWSAFMRPGKRLKVGDRVAFGNREDRACEDERLDAVIAEKHEGGEVVLAFDLSGPDLDIGIAKHGDMPLPPYIAAKRGEDERDRADYQTVYAREDGSVAAPTAGLHFTPALLEDTCVRPTVLASVAAAPSTRSLTSTLATAVPPVTPLTATPVSSTASIPRTTPVTVAVSHMVESAMLQMR